MSVAAATLNFAEDPEAWTARFPEFGEAEKDSLGRFYCKYCRSWYGTKYTYQNHLNTKRTCKSIRRAMGIPILWDREFPCKKCGKSFVANTTRINHELKCRGGAIRVFPINGKSRDAETQTEATDEGPEVVSDFPTDSEAETDDAKV